MDHIGQGKVSSPIVSSRKTNVVAATLNRDSGATGLKSITRRYQVLLCRPERCRLDWGVRLKTQNTAAGASSAHPGPEEQQVRR